MSILDITGLAHLIVNDKSYAELQAKAFRDISQSSNDDSGAAKGVRMFLEFLERNASEFNASEFPIPKKAGQKKSDPVEAQYSGPVFNVISTAPGNPGTDADLNPPNDQ